MAGVLSITGPGVGAVALAAGGDLTRVLGVFQRGGGGLAGLQTLVTGLNEVVGIHILGTGNTDLALARPQVFRAAVPSSIDEIKRDGKLLARAWRATELPGVQKYAPFVTFSIADLVTAVHDGLEPEKDFIELVEAGLLVKLATQLFNRLVTLRMGTSQVADLKPHVVLKGLRKVSGLAAIKVAAMREVIEALDDDTLKERGGFDLVRDLPSFFG